jgi:hypothetical protein
LPGFASVAHARLLADVQQIERVFFEQMVTGFVKHFTIQLVVAQWAAYRLICADADDAGSSE